MTTGSLLGRNTLLNIVTQVLVAFIALASIPFVVHAIGEEQFGFLALIWLLVGYFSILDFGLGQASVKFLAGLFQGSDAKEAHRIIVVSSLASVVIGLLGSGVIAVSSSFLIEKAFRITPQHLAVARTSILWAASALPFIMLQGSLRAVPMALQRFELVNALQAGSGVLQWGGAVVLVMMGMGLAEIVILTVVIRIAGAIVAFFIVHYLVPDLSWRTSGPLLPTAGRLMRFGGWLSVTQVVSPLVGYLDRIFIGTLLGTRLVAFYTVPFEALSRLQVIPQGLSTALFPAIAAIGRGGRIDHGEVWRLFDRALRLLLVVMVPLSLSLAVFSPEILRLWLGPGDFPSLSSTVFSVLAVALIFHTITYVPLTVLQAIGRPDIVAKFNLLEVPVYGALCALSISAYGIDGAAFAWLTRLMFWTVALLGAIHHEIQLPLNDSWKTWIWRLALLAAIFLLVILGIRSSSVQLGYKIFGMVFLCAGFWAASWFWCLGPEDRSSVRRLLPMRYQTKAS